MRMTDRPIYPALLLLAVLALSLMGCGIDVQESRYYAAYNPSGEVSVYRLDIKANAQLTEGKYASGWYPRASVDSLTGAVNADQILKDLKTRIAIEQEIDKKVLAAYKEWLKIAANPASDPKDRQKTLDTLRLVLSYPTTENFQREGMCYIEYQPTEGIVMRHADEKMVFLLSSDPTKVLNAINNFTQSTEAALNINQLSDLFNAQALGEHGTLMASMHATRNYGHLIEGELDALATSPPTDTASQKATISEMTKLIEMLQSMP
ncbi:hypothetical protein BerOc1_02679 [Pseudodesulfovibrio hydrargyri]|uniref:Uncharacterized protein n=1 Tax=Pseudodesulfovibrio hydrargyri TaxID=2125990 RepID=A0A1J5NGA9_9BACT|nr:hypothetical protein [Pseudodesulfovibrio hydrargyri]OIQ50737.1 hypothetical protein BerOc1_02679 [Pseudodesulfovibrio hydrargyri]